MAEPDTDQAAQVSDDQPADDQPPILGRFARLALPYFSAEEKWIARALLVGVVVLTLLQLGIQVRINWWNKEFFDALEQRNWPDFLGAMGLFAVLAAASMVVLVYQYYVRMVLSLRWRRWLTERLVTGWLADANHYQLNFIGAGIDNPDQRIAENVMGATKMSVEFVVGIVNAALTLIAFSVILWTLSGPLEFNLFGERFNIPGYMVWAALIYAGAGSLATYFIGKPIVAANVGKEAAEGDYRFALVRLRENSEGVALIRGEEDEKEVLDGYFVSVMKATMRLLRAERRLMWLTSSYGLLGLVYPALVASPGYFSGSITLGGLMQITAAFVQVQVGLNWFVDNFPKIAEWRAHVQRVLEFNDAIDTTAEVTTEEGEAAVIALSEQGAGEDEAELSFERLRIAFPDGSTVIENADTSIKQGERVLIVGESGSGKSTLFRAIAGLWPWGDGAIHHPPKDSMMFMPQRPYLPLGTLHAALAYPDAPDTFPKEEAAAALERCELEHLVQRLDEEDRWDRILSGGEQQRVAFARLLLHKPAWVFMDEATSALDEDQQARMLGLFDEELAGSTAVSIAHRPDLDKFHDRTLSLSKSAHGVRLVTRRRTPARERRRLFRLRRRERQRRAEAAE
jgi:vitamin B12/bleomycin/antimicrobial peptide transport system ATP-binding/permease protein